ncbi:spore germination protein [Leptolyngbya sp. Heron Island J]|uniref:GerMN domain-containing protein n=1 Tax=Leptolyngbya sp. Heron Island J TaxID=1385935 RepID=UPI0003B96705|nr:GerMN domain-containing protein [Leptolyngbya sp. Heron Island J]ESA37452.1 spore germination protein [Leptolyngbya sp. Heron Island J]
MNAQKTLPHFSLKTLEMYIAAIILGAAAGWGYWWTSQQTYSLEGATPVQSFDISDVVTKLKSSLPEKLAVLVNVQPQAYWVSIVDQQEMLLPQPLSWETQVAPETMLANTIEILLSGAVKVDDAFTTIPKDTQLLSLTITPKGIYINLSQEFAEGGGSSSIIYRVAQVIYTVTSLDPDAAVYLSVAGHLIDEAYPLGGEGLILEQPVTRQTFAKDFSIFRNNEVDL